MAQSENDFEKGEQFDNLAFIALVSTLVELWTPNTKVLVDDKLDRKIGR